MKTTFSSHSEVCHEFANNFDETRKGKAGNIFFEGLTLYSYGDHYILAQKVFIDGTWFTFVNENNYSVSTSKHKNHTRQALRGQSHLIYIPFFTNRAFYLHQLGEVANLLKVEINQSLKTQIKARSNSYHMREANSRLTLLRTLNVLFPTYVNAINDLYNEFPLWEQARDKAEYIQANEQERNERKEVLAKERKALEIEKEKEHLFDWVNNNYNGTLYNLPIHLRLTSDKKEIQTSHGAKVPTLQAVKMFKDIQDLKNVTGQSIGNFTVREVTLDFIQIGCHKIEFKNVVTFLNGL
mgnify:CR=1 FL=1|tara:strand:- start:19077 stop:19964 length:888 start_codon:yes stop_codon:yes gene_type:complete